MLLLFYTTQESARVWDIACELCLWEIKTWVLYIQDMHIRNQDPEQMLVIKAQNFRQPHSTESASWVFCCISGRLGDDADWDKFREHDFGWRRNSTKFSVQTSSWKRSSISRRCSWSAVKASRLPCPAMADGQGCPFCRFCKVTCMIRSSTQTKSVNQKVLIQIFIKHLKTSFSDINGYWLLEGERRLQQINKQQRNSPIVQNDESTLTGPPKSCCKFKSQLHQINPEPSTNLVKKISQRLIAEKSPQQTLIDNVPISKVDCREKPLHQQLLSTMFQLSQRLIAEEISTTKL